ncbi:MAG: hypothetical protein ACOYOL_12880 [Chthoniobacterales bacterium]
MALVLAVLVQHRSARPNLRTFDPNEMGRMESAMWRSYYEGQWVRLGWQAMQLGCGQYGFSWWDSARMSAHAAVSAMHFRINTDDPRCLAELVSYYRIAQRAVSSRWDVQEMARLELQWWKERRESAPSDAYARTVARLTGSLYDIDAAAALPAALLRTGAMAYRDARRDGAMTEADWREVTRRLTEAYTLLKKEPAAQP